MGRWYRGLSSGGRWRQQHHDTDRRLDKPQFDTVSHDQLFTLSYQVPFIVIVIVIVIVHSTRPFHIEPSFSLQSP